MRCRRRRRHIERDSFADLQGVCVELKLMKFQDGRIVPVLFPFKKEHNDEIQAWLKAYVDGTLAQTISSRKDHPGVTSNP